VLMMHDFAITARYAIFFDLNVALRGPNLAKGKEMIVCDKKRPCRFGVLPKKAKSQDEMKWFAIENCFMFHVANSYETKDNKIILTGCRYEALNMAFKNVFAEPVDTLPRLYEWTLDMTTGKATEKKLSNELVEFPRVHPALLGRPAKYTFAAQLDTECDSLVGAVKYDLTTGKLLGTLRHGKGRFGGEPVFVPREESKEEDDGYLLTFVYDESTKTSDFVVYDAKTMSSDPVALVCLPVRVPHGFHGLFISEAQLKSQKPLPPPTA
jgi:carotenoid cleavage dioxygenase-like enzyme